MSSKVAIRLRADDRQAPLLVRVEPRQVQVRDDARGEAQVAEDDVLDALAHEGGAVREALLGLLADQVQRRPTRRARRGSTARSRRRAACRGSGGCRRRSTAPRARRRRSAPSGGATAGWYSSRWPTIRILPARSRRRDRALGVGRGRRERLLHEAVLAGLRAPRPPARRASARAWPARPRRARGRRAGPAAPPSCARRGNACASRSRACSAGSHSHAARSRRSRRGCARGSGPSSRGPRRPTRMLTPAARRRRRRRRRPRR